MRKFEIEYELNPYLVRGLDYYTHTTFEFKVSNSNLGATKDTVLAGGRYNELVKILGGPSIPAIGWASGIERLKLLIKDEDENNQNEILISFIFVYFQNETLLYEGLKIIQKLRNLDFIVNYLEEGTLKKQIEKSNSIQSKFSIFFGEDEFLKEEIKIKEMKTGKEENIKIKDLSKKNFNLNN